MTEEEDAAGSGYRGNAREVGWAFIGENGNVDLGTNSVIVQFLTPEQQDAASAAGDEPTPIAGHFSQVFYNLAGEIVSIFVIMGEDPDPGDVKP